MGHSVQKSGAARRVRKDGGCLQALILVLVMPSTLIAIGLLLIAATVQYYPSVLSSKMFAVGIVVALTSATSGFCVGRFVGR